VRYREPTAVVSREAERAAGTAEQKEDADEAGTDVDADAELTEDGDGARERFGRKRFRSPSRELCTGGGRGSLIL
jgi:hypothetical protein